MEARTSHGDGALGHDGGVQTTPNTDPTNSWLTPRLQRWRRATDLPLVALAVGSLPILLLELQRDELPRSDRLLMDITNALVLVAFAIDYAVELWLAGDRRRYARSEWASALIVLAQIAALAPSLAGLGALRALRAGRLLRLVGLGLRAIAIGGTAKQSGQDLLRRHAAALAFSVAGLTWLTSAAAFTLTEDVGTSGRIGSFFDALWWSLATITTVGYGDIYPVTAAGRVIGGFTMIIGISTFALVTAKVAQFLVRSEEDRGSPPAGVVGRER